MRGQGNPPGEFKPHAPLNMIPVYRTLQELKASSPSRAHGLSEEDEESWTRAAINLITTASSTLSMDFTCYYFAYELFYRFYAKNSMVTNDRFLMSMACMYLGAKLADFPKSGRDIIYACVEHMCTREESIRLRSDSEWMKHTRQALNDAERALLYSIGFRFTWTPAPNFILLILGNTDDGSIGKFLSEYYQHNSDKNRGHLTTLAHRFAWKSTKIPLALQYPTEAIAAACIWLGMKFLKINTVPPLFRDPVTGQSKQWYGAFGLENEDLVIISDQITAMWVEDAEGVENVINSAVTVKAEFVVAANGNNGVAPAVLGGKGESGGGGR